MESNNLKTCTSCLCFCWLVPGDCIVNFSEITSVGLIRNSDINNANYAVGDMIGEQCFNELCSAVSSALQKANEFNEANTGVTKTVFDFLSKEWTALLMNRHFQKWYSEKVAFYWFEGSSITQLKKVGLVTTSNDDEEYKNGFEHAAEKQRKRLSENADRYASEAKEKFITHFWSCPPYKYNCIPNDCDCDSNEEMTGESIGMIGLN